MGKDGNYLEPQYIVTMMVKELNWGMSYDEIGAIVRDAKVYLTDEQVKKFLNKTMDEEQPGLKEKLNVRHPIGLVQLNAVNIKEMMEREANRFKAYKYSYEPYTLTYFKRYISLLQTKLLKLFVLIDDLLNKRAYYSELESLDIHINKQGNILYEDVIRLAECAIYNLNDLIDKLTSANTLETYLNFKQAECFMDKEGIHHPHYPRQDLQIQSLYYQYSKEFVAFSPAQLSKLKHNKLRNLELIIDAIVED